MNALLRCPASKTKINGLIPAAAIAVTTIAREKKKTFRKDPEQSTTKTTTDRRSLVGLVCYLWKHHARSRGCKDEPKEASKELIIQLKVNEAKPFGCCCPFCFGGTVVLLCIRGHTATGYSVISGSSDLQRFFVVVVLIRAFLFLHPSSRSPAAQDA